MAFKGIRILCLALAAIPVFGIGDEGILMARIGPEIAKHLKYAREDVREGNYQTALAHTDLLLFSKPIRYSLDLDSIGFDRREECEKAMEASLEMWKQSLDSQIQFEQVDSSENPEIRVKFQPTVYLHGNHVGGSISWKRTVRTCGDEVESSMTADIMVCTVRPGGADMTFDQLRHAIAHEFGHVLGLGDSNRVGDLMGPINPSCPVEEVTDRERKALQDFRAEAMSLRSQALVGTFAKYAKL